MKILHLITRLDFGGSSENVVLSAQGGVKAGHEVLIVSGPSAALSEAAEDVRGLCVLLPNMVRQLSPWKDLKSFFQMLRLLRHWKPDIVHTHSSKAGILGRWTAWIYRTVLRPKGAPRPRIIHTPHGHVFYGYFTPLRSRFYLALERITAKITDDLVALTEGEKQESLERGVGEPGQWSVIFSGVSTARSLTHKDFETITALRANIPLSAVVIGCIARLDRVKGIDILIEAAGLIRSAEVGRHAVFLIVGDGEERRALENQALALGIVGAVVFVGYQKDPWPFLQVMNIYVQPSLNEGMGKTLVMAQAAGLPVVASRVCGIPDVVHNGESGFLVPPSDPKALADAILRLISDKPLRKSIGQNAQRWIESVDELGLPRFSVESMVAHLEKLYVPK